MIEQAAIGRRLVGFVVLGQHFLSLVDQVCTIGRTHGNLGLCSKDGRDRVGRRERRVLASA